MRKKMDIKNKIAIGAIILLLALFTAHLAEAGGEVSIWDIDVYYDGETYEGEIVLENYSDINVTAVVEVYVDGKSVLSDKVELNVRYFKGFRIGKQTCIYFNVPGEEGRHEGNVVVLIGTTSIYEDFTYEGYGYAITDDEEEEEIVEDWLECP